MKVCKKCGTLKDKDSFNKKPDSKDGLQYHCKKCAQKSQNISRRARYDPLKNKDQMLKRDFGITLETAQHMLEDQQNKCLICAMDITLDTGITTLGKAHVDHCHTTGKVRGLLCSRCNVLLGMATDNPEVLKAAITYLERGQDD